jgi:hypothetical protein
MPRLTAEKLGAEYRDAHKAAKPADRAAVNAAFQRELTDLLSQLDSDLVTRESKLVDAADDLPAKRRIRQEIADIQLEAGDIKDLLALIDRRMPEDDRQSRDGKAVSFGVRRRAIEKQDSSLDGEYTSQARALAKTLEAKRKLRAASDDLNAESQALYDQGCEAAQSGFGAVGLLKGLGFLDELVSLPTVSKHGGVAIWGKLVTDDSVPPRPLVPDPISDDWGCSIQNDRVTSPMPGSREDRDRIARIGRQRAEREDAIVRAAAWDRMYGAA